MMHVEVDQGHALQAVHIQGVSHPDGHVVEEAKTHGGVALGMVARRAHAAKRGGGLARQHQVGGFHRRTGRAQGRCDGVGVHVGVGVDRMEAFLRRSVHQLVDVIRRMGAAELLHGGQRRVVGNHVVEQALDQQVVVDGAQALGAFGVVVAHVVQGTVGVRDVGGQHGSRSPVPGQPLGRVAKLENPTLVLKTDSCLDVTQRHTRPVGSQCSPVRLAATARLKGVKRSPAPSMVRRSQRDGTSSRV